MNSVPMSEHVPIAASSGAAIEALPQVVPSMDMSGMSDDCDCAILEFDGDDFLDIGLCLDENDPVFKRRLSVAPTQASAPDAVKSDSLAPPASMKKGADVSPPEAVPSATVSAGKKRPRSSSNSPAIVSDDDESIATAERPMKRYASESSSCSFASVAASVAASFGEGSTTTATEGLPSRVSTPALPAWPTKVSPPSSVPLSPSDISIPAFTVPHALHARMMENLHASMMRTEKSREYFERNPEAFSLVKAKAALMEKDGDKALCPKVQVSGFFDGTKSTLTAGLEISRRLLQGFNAPKIGGARVISATAWR